MEGTCPQSIQIRVASTNKKQKPESSVDNQTPTCRICLDQMEPPQIFHPCQCRGSNSFFHEECLMEWIKKVKKHKHSFRTYYHVCQICKGRIFLQTNLKYRCLTMEEAKQELFQKQICCTITTIIFLFCSFTVLGIILYISSLAQSKAQIVVYSIGLAVTLVTIIITIIVYIYKYTIKTDVITVGIEKQKQDLKATSTSKVVPLRLAPIQHRIKNVINLNQNLELNQSLDGLLINNTINNTIVFQSQ